MRSEFIYSDGLAMRLGKYVLFVDSQWHKHVLQPLEMTACHLSWISMRAPQQSLHEDNQVAEFTSVTWISAHTVEPSIHSCIY